MGTFNHFYDLPVYKTTREFRKRVSHVINEFFPKKVLEDSNNYLFYRYEIRK